jgi:hypothetical protein
MSARMLCFLARGHCSAFSDRNLPAAAAALLNSSRHLSESQLGLAGWTGHHANLPGGHAEKLAAGELALPLSPAFGVCRGLAAWLASLCARGIVRHSGCRANTPVVMRQAAQVALAFSMIIQCSSPRSRDLSWRSSGAVLTCWRSAWCWRRSQGGCPFRALHAGGCCA